MKPWIDITQLTSARSSPWLVNSHDEIQFEQSANRLGATTVQVSLENASSVSDVLNELRRVLPFPAWMGSSWDSVDDTYDEIQESWSFPLVVVVRGLDALLDRELHLALTTVVHFTEFQREFSSRQLQLEFVYLIG